MVHMSVSWKIESLPAEQARSICGMHWLDSAVDEDYGACPNMAHVACRRVRQVWGAWRESRIVHPLWTNRTPLSRDRYEDGMTCARTCWPVLRVEGVIIFPCSNNKWLQKWFKARSKLGALIRLRRDGAVSNVPSRQITGKQRTPCHEK
jgi:hypothetical protein